MLLLLSIDFSIEQKKKKTCHSCFFFFVVSIQIESSGKRFMEVWISNSDEIDRNLEHDFQWACVCKRLNIFSTHILNAHLFNDWPKPRFKTQQNKKKNSTSNKKQKGGSWKNTIKKTKYSRLVTCFENTRPNVYTQKGTSREKWEIMKNFMSQRTTRLINVGSLHFVT